MHRSPEATPGGTEEPRRLPECRCQLLPPAAWVNGVRIDPLTPDQTLRRVEEHLSCPAAHVVNHLPAHPTVLARRDPSFRKVLNRADLNVADGKGVVWACRLQGFSHMSRRVYGPDFLLDMATWGLEHGLRHAFVGGDETTIERLVRRLSERSPGLLVAGTHSPPVREVSENGVAEDLEPLPDHPDVLWVGLGTPKQQLWADLARKHRPATVIFTVGAAFDFLAGAKPQAPRWLRDAGFEWAFRLATEPRRLWRRALVDNAAFAWHVARDLATSRRAAGR